jgi:hypothetical protein
MIESRKTLLPPRLPTRPAKDQGVLTKYFRIDKNIAQWPTERTRERFPRTFPGDILGSLVNQIASLLLVTPIVSGSPSLLGWAMAMAVQLFVLLVSHQDPWSSPRVLPSSSCLDIYSNT